MEHPAHGPAQVGLWPWRALPPAHIIMPSRPAHHFRCMLKCPFTVSFHTVSFHSEADVGGRFSGGDLAALLSSPVGIALVIERFEI